MPLFCRNDSPPSPFRVEEVKYDLVTAAMLEIS